MSSSLEALESRRSALLRQIQLLGEFRPGSISATSGRCRCRQPDHPGHGPNLRLTFRRNGKTVSVSLPSEAARRKAQREIEEFRRQGLFVGSGVIASRLKRSGMHWSVRGANAVTALRCCRLSDRCDDYWENRRRAA